MDYQRILIFALTFFVFAVTPGPDNFTIVARTWSHNIASSIVYGLGVITSILFFFLASAFGFSLIAEYINKDLYIIEFIGAAYLIYLGLRSFFSYHEIFANKSQGSLVKIYFTGIGLNASNPKMPLFYLALIPSTLGVNILSIQEVIVLIITILIIETIVMGSYIILAKQSMKMFSDPKKMKILYKISGALLIFIGIIIILQ